MDHPTFDELGSIQALKENYVVEAKKAQGRQGDGAVPGSMWETYSAFANTKGGWILLGVGETADGFQRDYRKSGDEALLSLFDGTGNSDDSGSSFHDSGSSFHDSESSFHDLESSFHDSGEDAGSGPWARHTTNHQPPTTRLLPWHVKVSF